jgi:hypothetical protein
LLGVGFAGESVKKDGDYVLAKLTITDSKSIEALKSGKRKEISLGYACELEEVPGEFQGQRYDAIQRNIVVNHIALGPSGWGRAGSACSIKLDSKDAVQIMEDPLAEENEVQKLKGRLDALTQELEKERKLRMDAQNPAFVAQKVNARLNLLEQCRPILENEFRFDGKSDRALKEAVILKNDTGIFLEDKNDAYIDGMFEGIVFLKSQRNDALCSAHEATTISKEKTDSVREQWKKKVRNLWTEPLAGRL